MLLYDNDEIANLATPLVIFMPTQRRARVRKTFLCLRYAVINVSSGIWLREVLVLLTPELFFLYFGHLLSTFYPDKHKVYNR